MLRLTDIYEPSSLIVPETTVNIGASLIRDVQELAASLHMSYGHLSRLYKKLTGQTIIDRLTKIRLERSVELLCHMDIPIQEVAEKTGFPNPYYFSRLFKTSFGLSPKEYREDIKPVRTLY